MGLYTVLKPCVVDNLHYAQVPAAPIIADDDVAADLVASGVLIPVDSGEKPPAAARSAPHRRRATGKEA